MNKQGIFYVILAQHLQMNILNSVAAQGLLETAFKLRFQNVKDTLHWSESNGF